MPISHGYLQLFQEGTWCMHIILNKQNILISVANNTLVTWHNMLLDISKVFNASSIIHNFFIRRPHEHSKKRLRKKQNTVSIWPTFTPLLFWSQAASACRVRACWSCPAGAAWSCGRAPQRPSPWSAPSPAPSPPVSGPSWRHPSYRRGAGRDGGGVESRGKLGHWGELFNFSL